MIELRISSHDATLGINTDDQRVIEYFRNNQMPRTQIPGYEITARKPDWQIIHRSSEHGVFGCSSKSKEMHIKGIFRKHTSEHDFTFLSLTALSRIQEEKHRTILHSSAVSDGTKTYILVANRGGGKSILATEFIYKRGMTLISGETTLLNESQVLAGTTVLSNRVPCVAQKYPELLEEKDRGHVENYDAKCYLPETFASKKAPLPQNIAGLYFITVSDDTPRLQRSLMPMYAGVYELLSNSSAYISGIGHTVMNFSQPHPDLETRQLRQNRLRLLRELMENVKMEELRGTVNQIADYVCGESR
jgi:hypothetical protein